MFIVLSCLAVPGPAEAAANFTGEIILADDLTTVDT